MKLSWAPSSIALALLLMTSCYTAASALQMQAERERDLNASLAAGNGVIIVEFGFAVGANNRIFRTQRIILDPVILNGFQDPNYNPARDGFRHNPARNGFNDNPARGQFMMNAPIRR